MIEYVSYSDIQAMIHFISLALREYKYVVLLIEHEVLDNGYDVEFTIYYACCRCGKIDILQGTMDCRSINDINIELPLELKHSTCCESTFNGEVVISPYKREIEYNDFIRLVARNLSDFRRTFISATSEYRSIRNIKIRYSCNTCKSINTISYEQFVKLAAFPDYNLGCEKKCCPVSGTIELLSRYAPQEPVNSPEDIDPIPERYTKISETHAVCSEGHILYFPVKKFNKTNSKKICPICRAFSDITLFWLLNKYHVDYEVKTVNIPKENRRKLGLVDLSSIVINFKNSKENVKGKIVFIDPKYNDELKPDEDELLIVIDNYRRLNDKRLCVKFLRRFNIID